jgi:hypothetical protein
LNVVRDGGAHRDPGRSGSPGRRLVALALLGLLFLPGYRLVDGRGSGPAVEQTLRLGGAYTLTAWVWTAVALVAIVILGSLLRPGLLAPIGGAARRRLLSATARTFGIGLALLAMFASLCVSLAILDGGPALVDGASQIIQARYFAAGDLAGPVLPDPAFWHFQFMVSSDAGWTSQYPPGFAVLLAPGWSLRLPWLVGPVALGAAAFLTTLIAERLFPDDRTVARLGAALMAVSPFLIFHAAAYMSHVVALLLVTIAVYASLRSLDGSLWWSVLTGAALGALFATRPYTAVVLGLFATVALWFGAPGVNDGDRTAGEQSLPGTFTTGTRTAPRTGPGSAVGRIRRLTVRAACVVAGAAPFIAGMLLYNARLFGRPTRFGYIAAEGPGHGLGFHIDPWGNPYGPAEAIGYTSADLAALSTDLLQAPLPTVAIIALFLLLSRRLGRGAALAAAWALLPVLGNAFYWHHDLFMGPRLLYEAAPGWCLLLAASVLWLVRTLPQTTTGPFRRRMALRDGVAAVLLVALAVAVLYAAPRKLASYRTPGARALSAAVAGIDRPSLVFVHGSWEARLGARLSALGMRLDSVRLALAHNSTCRVERAVERVEAERASRTATGSGSGAQPRVAPDNVNASGPDVPGRERVSQAGDYQTEVLPLDLRFAASVGAPLRVLRMPSGSVMRSYEGETLDPRCERQAASDFRGIIELPSLLWRGDLPGLGDDGALFVRDFGPDWNTRLLARFPARHARVLIRNGSAFRLVSYDEAMTELWPVN